MKSHAHVDLALLLVRVGLGLVFMAHGWDKASSMEGTIHAFSSIGLPAIVAYVVTYVELLGGFAMFIGLFTGWAGILLALTMLGAIGKVKLSLGFIGGFEFDLMLFLAAIAISLSGPGKYSTRFFEKAE